MFGDWQWNPRRTDGQSAALRQWLNRVSENKASLAVVEAGAGRAVSTVRSTSEAIAAGYGAALVRINPRDFDVPPERHVSIPLGALEGIAGSSKRPENDLQQVNLELLSSTSSKREQKSRDLPQGVHAQDLWAAVAD